MPILAPVIKKAFKPGGGGLNQLFRDQRLYDPCMPVEKAVEFCFCTVFNVIYVFLYGLGYMVIENFLII